MKNVIVLLSFSLFSTFAFAQQIEVSEAPRAMKNGMANSFSFELPDVTLENATKEWEKLMKSYRAKTKFDRKSKSYVSTGARIPRLAYSDLTVYTNIIGDKKGKEGVSMIVWFSEGNEYISSTVDEEKANNANTMLTEFALSTSKHQAEAIVAAEEKALGKAEKQMDKLIKDNRDYHKAIEKAKEAIEKAKEAISENEKNIEINVVDQKKQEAAIKAQKEAVEKAKEYVKTYNN